MNLRYRFSLLASLLCLPTSPAAGETAIYQNPGAPLETRVADLMKRLTEDEKIRMLAGTEFTTQPIPRLGIPAMVMADAGQGVRGGMDSTLGPATAFPSGVAMASTWNPELIGEVGKAIGIEARNKGTGVQVMLGPAVNIQRSPLGGRNGEYLSEDPFLAGRLAVGYIKGMQGTGTVACIKHFLCNNEENDRFTVNVQVSERALREIYLPAFEAGVKEGGAWTLMSSYNRINGPYASANQYYLTDVLKRCWGFDGMVMSDWGGVHQASPTINAGNDLEMPGRGFLEPAKVKAALEHKRVTPEQIEQNVTRIVRTILRSGVMNDTRKPDPALVNSKAARSVALRTAQESIVLLKNENKLLPLDPGKIRSIAVFGPAGKEMEMGAAGSPAVEPLQSIGPVEGIRSRAGAGATVTYASGSTIGTEFTSGVLKASSGEGFAGEYFDNATLEGKPEIRRADSQIDFVRPPAPLNKSKWSARWTTTLTARKSGSTIFHFRADDGCRLFVDDKPVIDHWQPSPAETLSATVELKANKSYKIRAEYYQGGGDGVAQLTWSEPGSDPENAVAELARQSDVAIVCVTTQGTEGEGGDRPSMSLPHGQDELIRRVAAANPHTIVVLNNGTPVAMPWLENVPAVIEAWFPGQEGGLALGQILFGEVNPSGHLPTTLGVKREDYPDYPNFGGDGRVVRYQEGIFVGYRGFDKHGITPLFPFGHGLSYTSFLMDGLKLSSPVLAADGKLAVSVRVTNTGERAGSEVAQLYISDPASGVERPVRELKGFRKVFLKPGESQVVTMSLSPRDFAWCDVETQGWRANAGTYQIELGDSSRHLTQSAKVELKDFFEPIPFMRADTSLPAPETAPDLALGRHATASSDHDGHRAEDSFDNNIKTRWQSQGRDNEWLAVDLGSSQKIGRVHLSWESAFASEYRIEVSDDGQNWRTVYATDASEGGEQDISFPPVKARHVRTFIVKRGTSFGASLLDFEVRAAATNAS